jgi:hypothetical protein
LNKSEHSKGRAELSNLNIWDFSISKAAVIDEFRKKLNKSKKINLINKYGLDISDFFVIKRTQWLNELGSWIT